MEQGRLDEAVVAAGLNIEGRPYPLLNRPLILSHDLATDIAKAAEWLVTVLDIAADLYLADRHVRALFPLCQILENYIATKSTMKPLVRVCRLDGIVDSHGRFRILETNAKCPGGVIQSAIATHAWTEANAALVTEFRVDSNAQPFVQRPDMFLEELISCHRSLRGEIPKRAGIINFAGRYTNEVDRLAAGLTRLGVDTDVIDAGVLRRTSGGLVDGQGRVIDMTYNKYRLTDFNNEPSVRDYLDAIVAEEVTYINPLMSQWVLADKAILALLSDSRFSANFSHADRTMIDRHVPWTRLVCESVTVLPNGIAGELIPYIENNRVSLVLKPSNATRGEGVVVGCFVTQAEWTDYLTSSASTTPYVVQEYVEPPNINILNPGNKTCQVVGAGVDAYVFGGRFAGFHARASQDSVVNVGRLEHKSFLLPVIVTKD